MIGFNVQLYQNTLSNWMSLDNNTGRILPILYDTSHYVPSENFTLSYPNITITIDNITELTTQAAELGWRVLAAPRVSDSGVPYFRDMFLDTASRFPNCAFYGYSNGDILFTRGLVRTLQAVAQVLT